MKNSKHNTARRAWFIAAVLLVAAALRASAQPYAINWFTVAGGGASSTGGVYKVTGTIAQPEPVGVVTGGNYSLTSGFWSLFVVQTAGAPVLGIKLITPTTARVYWPSPSPGFGLQVSASPAGPNWLTPPETVQNDGTVNFIVVTPPAGNRFYRLKSQ